MDANRSELLQAAVVAVIAGVFLTVVLFFTVFSTGGPTGPINETLYAVTMVDGDRGYIGGANGLLLRWNGDDWVRMENPAYRPIRDIAVQGEDIWLAISTLHHQGTLYHYDGQQWHRDAPKSHGYIDVAVAGSTVWATGHSHPGFDEEGHARSEQNVGIYRKTADGWTDTLSQSVGEVATLAFRSPSNGYASAFKQGQAGILRWDGSGWRFISLPGDSRTKILDFSLQSNDRFKAVGFPISDNESIVHGQGENWTVISAPTEERLHAIDTVPGDLAWAVGGESNILHWDGGEWRLNRYERQEYNFFDIDMVGRNHGWIVGGNRTILEWNGTAWSRYPLQR